MAKKTKEEPFGVLLDTSFILRLLNSQDSIHEKALDYFNFFIRNENPMYFSTISIAEYTVGGAFEDLPLELLRIVPFNIDHAKEAGKLARTCLEARRSGYIELDKRVIIPNDCKLFAQGSVLNDVKYFVTADVKSASVIKLLQDKHNIGLEHLDINVSVHENFGILPL